MKSKKPSNRLPAYCSQRELAKILARLFSTVVYPMQIGRALKNEGMPGLQTDGSIKTGMAIHWWRANKIEVKAGTTGDLSKRSIEADMQRKIDEARTARIEADESERELDAKWILKEEARLSISGAVKIHHIFFKRQMEKVFAARLMELLTPTDFSESQVARFKEAFHRVGRETISAVENDCMSY